MKKRILAFALAALTLTTLTLAAGASAALAAPAPIGPEDFVIRIGKTDFDFLTSETGVAVRASGKKLKKASYQGEGEVLIEYVLKAREATFYFPESQDYCDRAALTKKGATARGIKIGSTLDALLAAYPAPNDIWSKEKETTYIYRVSNPPERMPDSVADNLDIVRPDYFYGLYINVSNKTNKVTRIIIFAEVG